MSDFQLPPLNNPRQFENMACDMFNEMFQVISFKSFGKNGHKQKGIDIFSSGKRIIIQCKLKDLTRNPIFLKKEMLASIEETVENLIATAPKIAFDDLFILSTISEHPDFDEYCQALKSEKTCPFNITFWGWETIQRKLSTCSQTIKTYYPNYISKEADAEKMGKARLSMKKRIEHDFGEWLNYSVENRKRSSRMIIHSIDDKVYPEHELNTNGEYQWFGAEINRVSKNGLGFFRELRDIYVTTGGWWTDKKPDDMTNFTITRVALVGVVPFEGIVDYDIKGDEHYLCPHFYLKFNHAGLPFFENYYQNMEKEKGGFLFFDDSTNIDLLKI